MLQIRPATIHDIAILTRLGRDTFVESHGSSAPEATIQSYLDNKYTTAVIEQELADPQYHWHIIEYEGTPAGYSRILFDTGHPSLQASRLTKLDRIYIQKTYYGTGAGKALFNFILALCKSRHQQGIWLFVWKGNSRAIRFYEKQGFSIAGSYDFPLSPTHSNPNHLLLLNLV